MSMLLLFISGYSAAQWVRWDGEANNGLWSDPLNWNTNAVPVSSDSVLLDNSLFSGSYLVTMPEGNTQVRILRLCIRPDQLNAIVLEWPSTNTAASGLWVQGTGGIQLYENATFINASGASPGTAIVISDSIYIYNGGRWIHRTTSGHASYLSKLSRSAETDRGVFEFDVPGTAGYAISITGRQFGTLELNNSTVSSTRTYFSNGIQSSIVRGSLIIRPKVNYSLDYNTTMNIQGDLICDGSLDLSAGSNTTTFALRGGLRGAGLITETGTVQPLIDLSGTRMQEIDFSGQISNAVRVQINNASDVQLKRSLTLPYQLLLILGRIHTTNENLLNIGPTGSILFDSTSSNSFINGPLRKVGLNSFQHFLFPVGKGTRMRWIKTNAVTGDLKVEYLRADPHALSLLLDSPLKHISRLEYWKVEFYQSGNATVALSFDDVNSGGVTELSSLTTAMLEADHWKSVGNTAVTGSAGGSGSVQSELLNREAGSYLFCLGSMNAFQNPLPLEKNTIKLKYDRRKNEIKWIAPVSLKRYELKINGSLYKNLSVDLQGISNEEQSMGSIKLPNLNGHTVIDMAGWDAKGIQFKSEPLSIYDPTGSFGMEQVVIDPSGSMLHIQLKGRLPKRVSLIVSDMFGRVIQRNMVALREGVNTLSIPVKAITAGVYSVSLNSDFNQVAAKRILFIR